MSPARRKFQLPVEAAVPPVAARRRGRRRWSWSGWGFVGRGIWRRRVAELGALPGDGRAAVVRPREWFGDASGGGGWQVR